MHNYEELEANAFPGQFSRYDMEVLVPEVEKIKPEGIYLEIGTDRGRSLSIARKVSHPSVEIVGVDIQDNPKVPGTKFIKSASCAASLSWKHFIDVLFIDGDHSYLGCFIDIQSWYLLVREGGVMLFHDCDETSPGVMRAVAEFVDTHKESVKEFKLFKRTDKNTSMALVRL